MTADPETKAMMDEAEPMFQAEMNRLRAKHTAETKRAMDDWGKVEMVAGAEISYRPVDQSARSALRSQFFVADYEIKLAAAHGIDLSFLREAWEQVLAGVDVDDLPEGFSSPCVSSAEAFTAVMEAVHSGAKTMRYNKRVKRQHGRAKTKKRHGARRGVRS